MGDRSKIEWTDASWNPVTGCTEISPGCDHCYAKTFAERWRGTPGHPFEHGFDITLRPERLTQPLRWIRPRRIFINSMSDLFHDDISDDYIAEVFAVMAQTPRHIFQLLTKRQGRMRSLINGDLYDIVARHLTDEYGQLAARIPWPLPNVHLGVSVETQKWANTRIPVLLDTLAAIRWVSCEPLLSAVDLTDCAGVNALQPDWIGGPGGGSGAPHPLLDWVVAGGESGRGARPMHPAWARSLRDQCADADVPYLMKQWGAWTPANRDTATHLVHIDGTAVARRDCAIDHPYGPGSGLGQDLIDRGHPGWERMRRVPKNRAGRHLDGRTHDGFPDTEPATP